MPFRFKNENDDIAKITINEILNYLPVGSSVFLNACESLSKEVMEDIYLLIREGWRLSGFVGTITKVNENLAIEFATTFYNALFNNLSFGRSLLAARLKASKISNMRWLSFVAFGNPLWQII